MLGEGSSKFGSALGAQLPGQGHARGQVRAGRHGLHLLPCTVPLALSNLYARLQLYDPLCLLLQLKSLQQQCIH